MTYEVQFQIGASQITVRGPDPDGVLSLVNDLQAPVDTAPPKESDQSTYERIWLQATKDLEGAMALVQNNSEFFGARCGDDKIKVVGEFFVKWAAEKLQPHAELRQTWEPGQTWQTRQCGQKEWIYIAGQPKWHADQEYRQCE